MKLGLPVRPATQRSSPRDSDPIYLAQPNDILRCMVALLQISQIIHIVSPSQLRSRPQGRSGLNCNTRRLEVSASSTIERR